MYPSSVSPAQKKISREMAKEQFEKAEKILQMLEPYLNQKKETL